MDNLNNQHVIGHIAAVKTGFTFRERINELPPEQGNAHILQIKDARKIAEESFSHFLNPALLPEICWDGKESAYGSIDSVFVPSRGGYFRAFCLKNSEQSPLPVVVSSQFLIVTPKYGVSAEFLCWYLNQPIMQRILSDSSQGTNMTMLSAEILKNIKIQIPPSEIQNKILRLHRLWEQEQRLTAALSKNREKIMLGMFQQLLKETN